MAKPNIVQAINQFNTWTPSQLVQAYDGSIGRASAALAGVPYEKGILKKNKAYQAQRRNLERYLQGTRKPSSATQEKMNALGKEQEKGKDIGMTLDGNICVNGRGPNYCRDRTIDRTFSPEDWDELSALAAERDEAGAWDYIAHHYGVNYLEVMDGTIEIGEE